MDRLKYIKPTKELEAEAIDFIKEFYEYNSSIEGVNGLHRYLDNYDEWLKKIEMERHQQVDDIVVPTETYFLVRESDQKIVGMATLRFALNKRFQKFGGNMGACIRPTERKKGYSKTILYLGLLEFANKGIREIMLDCDKANLGSANCIKALGGKLVKEEVIEDLECIKQDYVIDVEDSIEKFAPIYNEMIKSDDLTEVQNKKQVILEGKILDIFYNQIVKEAQKGRVDCYFMMNLCFNLIIENEQKTFCDVDYEGLLIPNLKISNKKLFDDLLIIYVKKALEIYDKTEFSFLEDLNYMNLTGDIDLIKENYLIKYIICSLFANLSYNDFENPLEFLQSRIEMFDNKILDDDSVVDLGYLETIGARLYVFEEKSPIKSETPYRLRGYLEYEDGYKLLLPEVYVGTTQDKYILYGLQKTTKRSDIDETNYIKQIRKGLISKINGVPEHYFLMIMVLLSLCHDKSIEVVPFLVERWNAKRISLSNKKDISKEEIEKYQENIQNNITNVFMRYFTKLEDVSTGLDFLSVPFEIDDRLHIRMDDDFISRAPVFNEIYNKVLDYNLEHGQVQNK